MQTVEIVPFSSMKHLGLILSWYVESEVEKTKYTVLQSCCTSNNYGFCYFEGDLCLGHFSLHVNPELKMGIVNYITLNPILNDKAFVITKILDHMMQFFTEKKLDSFEIDTLTTPIEVFKILRQHLVSRSSILEKRLKI